MMPVRPGSMGRAVPGHEVAVIDDDGRVRRRRRGRRDRRRRARPGDVPRVLEPARGDRAPSSAATGCGPATAASIDDDGYLWYQARNDDVITSGGYRIGPGEIEDCLIRHPAVAMAAVVGVPDPDRTEIVKAFVVLRPGTVPSDALTAEIQAFVRERLAAHEYPREIEYVAELPLTATGKVMRRELRARSVDRRPVVGVDPDDEHRGAASAASTSRTSPSCGIAPSQRR